MTGQLPVVVALRPVDHALVAGVLDGHCRFVPDPGDTELAVAAGAIARADARVDRAVLDKAPALRVVARTGVGVELVDVPAATARGIAVVVTPGTGTAAVAEGAIGMALHLVKRFGPLTALVRAGAPLPTGADDAVATMQLIDDCYRAAGLTPRPAREPLIKEIQP